MNSLLTTAVDESCQLHGVLRGRRRSSVRPLSSVPRLLLCQHSTATAGSGSGCSDESALVYEAENTPGTLPKDVTLPVLSIAPISPLSHAHVSDYASKMIIPRHHDSSGSTIDLNLASPSSAPPNSSPTTTVNSRKGSYDDFGTHKPLSGGYGTAPRTAEVTKVFERIQWRIAAGYFAYFMCGWGDGITGTVLPFFMADFRVSYTMTSLLFTGTTLGFLTGTLLVEAILKVLSHTLIDRERSLWIPYLSRPHLKKPSVHGGIRGSFLQAQHLSLVYSSLLHASFFVLMGLTRGYATIFVAYVVAAFARAILTATLNQYFITVHPQSLGYSYGLWSIGGVISPLICQSLVATGIPWKHFYYGSLVLSAFNTGLLSLTFRPTTKEWIQERQEARKQTEKERINDSKILEPEDKWDGSACGQDLSNGSGPAQKSALRKAFSSGMGWAFLFFTLMYCGTETSTQGFIVSYLLGTRHANPKTVGYVSSGFWAGISIGRFAWGYSMPSLSFTQKKWLVHASLAIGLVMELLIWFVDSNAANAFFASVIGLVFGPVYPAALTLATALLPEEVHMVIMALLGASGSLGAAIFPFVAGFISTLQGVHTVTYVTVSLAGSLFVMWFFFPSRQPNVAK